MNYRSRKKNKKIFIGFGVSLLLAILVLVFGIGKNTIANTFSPILNIGANAKDGTRGLFGIFNEKMDLVKEIERLKQENKRLKMVNKDRAIILKENRDLKREAGRNEDRSPLILARVVSKPPVSPFDIFVIDLGSEHGIENGSKVFAAENTEIGFVSSTKERHSTVTLYSSSDERTPVEINNAGALVIAEGEGGGSLTIQAPRTLEAEKGDVLTRPTLNSPTIGIIESTEMGETDSFMTVRARLPINIFEVSWVYVQAPEN